MIKTEIYLYKDNPEECWRKPGTAAIQGGPVQVVQGEAGSEELEFHLSQDSFQPLDLTGKTVTYYFTKPDGERIYLQANIPAETAAQGIACTTLTAQSTAACGLTKHGEVRVTSADGSVLKFIVPDLYIAYSDSETALQSTSEFQALDLALSTTNSNLQDAKKVVSDAESVLNQYQTLLESLQDAIQNAQTSTQKANQAADGANSATAAANSAATAANNATIAANTSAGTASAAAESCENALSDISAAAKAEVDKHAARTDNPHGVMAIQTGAVAVLPCGTLSAANLNDMCYPYNYETTIDPATAQQLGLQNYYYHLKYRHSGSGGYGVQEAQFLSGCFGNIIYTRNSQGTVWESWKTITPT